MSRFAILVGPPSACQGDRMGLTEPGFPPFANTGPWLGAQIAEAGADSEAALQGAGQGWP